MDIWVFKNKKVYDQTWFILEESLKQSDRSSIKYYAATILIFDKSFVIFLKKKKSQIIQNKQSEQSSHTLSTKLIHQENNVGLIGSEYHQ